MEATQIAARRQKCALAVCADMTSGAELSSSLRKWLAEIVGRCSSPLSNTVSTARCRQFLDRAFRRGERASICAGERRAVLRYQPDQCGDAWPNWKDCTIFLSWDDWGGFYDHVVPVTVDQNGYGLRVPGIIISPYAKWGHIDHQVLSFDAYVKFIEDDFLGGQRLDPKTDGRPDPRPDVREDAGAVMRSEERTSISTNRLARRFSAREPFDRSAASAGDGAVMISLPSLLDEVKACRVPHVRPPQAGVHGSIKSSSDPNFSLTLSRTLD